ncbi:MAG: TPM domain-containing protein, partial [Erysipelotrichaceae bacterium]|nr:TPM domain-containing protein [Erysipelotrichaceae bacterium]
MRKFIKVFILILLLSFVCIPVGKDVHADQGYRIIIDDQEDLLSDNEEKLLRIKMSEILEYGNAAFVTVSQYSDTGSYAKRLYKSYFGSDSGILFLIDMGRRNIWIHCNGAIYRIIDKAYANTITDNIYRYASRGEYYECADRVFDQALTLLRGGKIAQPMKYISNALIACVVALLVNFLFLTLQRQEDYVNPDTAIPAMTTGIAVAVISKLKTRSKTTKHVEYSSSGGGYSGGGGGGYSGGGGGGGG